jgi:hypothetical protein
MHVNGLVGATVRQSPYVREQFTLRDHLTRAHGQVVQQVELAPGQVELPVVQRCLVRLSVQAEPAYDDRLAAPELVSCRSPQYGPDPGLNLADAERLDQVVIGARVEHLDDVRLVVPGGRDDDGYLTDRSEHAQRFVPIEVGQAEIKDHKIGGRIDHELQRFHGVRRTRNGMATLGKRTHQGAADRGVIVDEQQLGHITNVAVTARSQHKIESLSLSSGGDREDCAAGLVLRKPLRSLNDFGGSLWSCVPES